MAKSNSGTNWLGLLAVGVAAVGVTYVLTRPEVNDLKKENARLWQRVSELDIKVDRQTEHLQAFGDYVREQDRRISNLEGNIDQIIAELIDVRQQLQTRFSDADIDQIMAALIQRAHQRRAQQAAPSGNLAIYS